MWNLIEGPRYHGKSEQLVIARPLWEIGKRHNIRIKVISNTDGEAVKRVVAIRDHIEHNPEVHDVFPKLRKGSPWKDHKITVDRPAIGVKDPTLEGFGILSSGTGGRADLLVLDDVVDMDNAIKNPALIDKVIDAYENKWINTLARNARVIFIFTRWHERDLSHRLIRQAIVDNIQKSTREQYKYTVDVIDDNLNPICPSMMNKEELKARLGSIGSRAFARGFQGRAMSAEEQIFSMIGSCVDTELTVEEITKRGYPNYGGMDLGHRKGRDKARTAIATIAVDPDTKKKYWLSVKAGRWSSPDSARKAIRAHKDYQYRRLNVENNAYQEAFLEWTREMEDSNGLRYVLKPFTTGKNKADEELGLPSLAVEMENGQWIIPHGERKFGPSCDCEFCATINEFLAHPIGEFSDRMMAVWFASEAARPPKAGIYIL